MAWYNPKTWFTPKTKTKEVAIAPTKTSQQEIDYVSTSPIPKGSTTAISTTGEKIIVTPSSKSTGTGYRTTTSGDRIITGGGAVSVSGTGAWEQSTKTSLIKSGLLKPQDASFVSEGYTYNPATNVNEPVRNFTPNGSIGPAPKNRILPLSWDLALINVGSKIQSSGEEFLPKPTSWVDYPMTAGYGYMTAGVVAVPNFVGGFIKSIGENDIQPKEPIARFTTPSVSDLFFVGGAVASGGFSSTKGTTSKTGASGFGDTPSIFNPKNSFLSIDTKTVGGAGTTITKIGTFGDYTAFKGSTLDIALSKNLQFTKSRSEWISVAKPTDYGIKTQGAGVTLRINGDKTLVSGFTNKQTAVNNPFVTDEFFGYTRTKTKTPGGENNIFDTITRIKPTDKGTYFKSSTLSADDFQYKQINIGYETQKKTSTSLPDFTKKFTSGGSSGIAPLKLDAEVFLKNTGQTTIPKVTTKVNPFENLFTSFSSKSVLTSKLKDKQIGIAGLQSATTTKNKSGLLYSNIYYPTSSTIQSQKIIPLLRTSTTTATSTRIDLVSTPTFVTPTITTPNTFIKTPSFFIPPVFDIPSFNFDAGKMSSRIYRGKQAKKYTPSFEALVFNIRGKAPKGLETGARTRPIPRGYSFANNKPAFSFGKGFSLPSSKFKLPKFNFSKFKTKRKKR